MCPVKIRKVTYSTAEGIFKTENLNTISSTHLSVYYLSIRQEAEAAEASQNASASASQSANMKVSQKCNCPVRYRYKCKHTKKMLTSGF